VIAAVKHEFPEYTLSVLTNGSLLTRRDVQDELLPADRVIPTLTTAFQQTFEHIHNPHPSLKVESIINGMVQFRSRYEGALWLEVFVIPGVNTTDVEREGLKAVIDRIDPDRVQLNTLDRPAAEGWVRAASGAELEAVKRALGRPGIEISGHQRSVSRAVLANTGSADLIRATLSRRPSTVEDLVQTTGLSGGEVAKCLGALERGGEVISQRGTRGVFYAMCQESEDREGG